MRFFRFIGYFSLVAVAATVLSCSEDSSDLETAPEESVWDLPQELSDDQYEQAESHATTEPERTAVVWARDLDGTREPRYYNPPKMQKLRQVFVDSQTPEVRTAIATGLGNALDMDSTDSLLDAMDDASRDVRLAAAKAILQIHGWGNEYQIDDPSEKRREVIAIYRERWSQVKESPRYEVGKDAQKKAEIIRRAQEKARRARRRERAENTSSN